MAVKVEEPIQLPLGPADSGSLRLVLFASPADAGRGEPFWLLRRHPEAAVYLGGLADASGEVYQLLELWVQRIGAMAAAFPVLAKDWTPADLDRKWKAMREDLAAADGPATLRLGIEDSPLDPLILDPSLGEHPHAGEWKLCRDDHALAAAGLPGHQSSFHRYLLNSTSGKWAALTAGAPLEGIALSFHEAIPDAVCFNPEGGRVFCRTAAVIGWSDYAGCLRGRNWRAGVPEAWLATLPPVYLELASDLDEHARWKHFLLPRMGPEAGPAEAFYLKLSLLCGAVGTIAATTARRGAPFLNLTDEHFGVRLSDGGDALPALWSARVTLARGAGAMTTGAGCYLPESTVTPGPYRIPGPLNCLTASGTLRIRKVGDVVDGMAAVEGTLQTDDDLSGKGGFRLEIRFAAGGGELVLPGEISPGASPGTSIFAGKVPAGVKSSLVEGASHSKVDVVLYPKLGSACDLYSLGILGLQLFLETRERSLPMVCDDALQLRDRIPPGVSPSSLPAALRDLALGLDAFSPETANAPEALWWETLSCIIRMLGGFKATAYFENAADGLENAPEAIYRQVLADLSGLLRRARVLVLGQGERNREIRDEIIALMEELRKSPE